MRSKNVLLRAVGTAILALCVAGCTTISIVAPLGSGYSVVTYKLNSFPEESAFESSLQYGTPDGRRVMVWPSLYGGNAIIKNDVAVFIGEMRNGDLRLFAVSAPEPPLDITGEAFRRWSTTSGKNFAGALRVTYNWYLKENEDRLDFHFDFKPGTDLPNLTVLDWSDVRSFMDEVKRKGALRRDRMRYKTYLQEEFNAEVQK